MLARYLQSSSASVVLPTNGNVRAYEGSNQVDSRTIVNLIQEEMYEIYSKSSQRTDSVDEN